MDPVDMFRRAATSALTLTDAVNAEHLALATPCTEWNVAALLEHMAGGTVYLLGALGVPVDAPLSRPDGALLGQCLDELARAGALDRRCLSPAGFEWSVLDATAGTAMDQLVHTWDLAVAIGADRRLDSDLCAAAVAMFLPDMPEIGRQAGFVGPAVTIADGAPVQDILLAAMGRDPAR
ncbi:MAG: maleylpyruvate isomerase family mycothiol-dependent enzyme [Acidimicrobiia bacterium]